MRLVFQGKKKANVSSNWPCLKGPSKRSKACWKLNIRDIFFVIEQRMYIYSFFIAPSYAIDRSQAVATPTHVELRKMYKTSREQTQTSVSLYEAHTYYILESTNPRKPTGRASKILPATKVTNKKLHERTINSPTALRARIIRGSENGCGNRLGTISDASALQQTYPLVSLVFRSSGFEHRRSKFRTIQKHSKQSQNINDR